MKKIFIAIFLSLLVLPAAGFAVVTDEPIEGEVVITETPSSQEVVQSLKQQISDLLAQIEELNQKILAIKQEIKTAVLELKTQLKEGSKGENVSLLQEFLSTDPEIYPEGLVTGFYGPLTRKAVQRFQKKAGLDQVGTVGPKTLSKVNELLQEGAGNSGKVPPGLLRAPGILKKLSADAPASCTDSSGHTMTLAEAKEIAAASECGDQFKTTTVCNETTGTYWIDLDIEKENCSPACVINLETKQAEINWRCTGLLTP